MRSEVVTSSDYLRAALVSALAVALAVSSVIGYRRSSQPRLWAAVGGYYSVLLCVYVVGVVCMDVHFLGPLLFLLLNVVTLPWTFLLATPFSEIIYDSASIVGAVIWCADDLPFVVHVLFFGGLNGALIYLHIRRTFYQQRPRQ